MISLLPGAAVPEPKSFVPYKSLSERSAFPIFDLSSDRIILSPEFLSSSSPEIDILAYACFQSHTAAVIGSDGVVSNTS